MWEGSEEEREGSDEEREGSEEGREEGGCVGRTKLLGREGGK